MIEIDVIAESGDWAALGDVEGLALKAARAALDVAGKTGEDFAVTLLLADDSRLRALNRDWRGKDKATNVLSFPAPAAGGGPQFGPRHLGDIALACETLEREAQQESKALPDHFAHLTIHGLLHLLGYDHESEEEAQIMEGLETKALASLGIADPYSDMAA